MPVQVLAGRRGDGLPVEVTVDGDRIRRVRPLPPDAVSADLWIIPGLVDLQVNGFQGADLNGADLDVDGVVHVARALQAIGVTRFCPTVCTQSYERMRHALAVIADACRRNPWVARAVAGVHVEGPYLSPDDGPRGVHPREHVRPPEWEEFAAFQRAADGRIRIVTLSPEWPDALAFIQRVSSAGVVVAIGHTAATPERIREAVAAGARLSTHLGNGSHAMLPRHPNYIWEQLAADALSASLIVDGHHLPPAVVKTFVRAKGVERTILVSDAVALAGMPPGEYDWLGLRVTLSADRRIGLTGTPYLAGSALDLTSALPRVMAYAGVSLADAAAMASANPASLLGLEAAALVEGGRADLVVLRHRVGEDHVQQLRIVVAGEVVWEAGEAVKK